MSLTRIPSHRKSRSPYAAKPPSRLLLLSTIAVAAATMAVPLLGELSRAFGFVPLTLAEIGAIICGYVIATEAAKARFFHPGRIAAQQG